MYDVSNPHILDIFFINYYFMYSTNLPRHRRVPVVSKVPSGSGSSVYLIPEISSFSSLVTAIHAL